MNKYFMPVEVYFGKDSLIEKGKLIKNYGNKALLVTGKNSAKISGVITDLLPVLHKSGIEYAIFDEIPENPDIQTILKGKNFFRDNVCDFVIGIGGGSPIDAAKAISVASANDFYYDEFYEPQKIKYSHPIIAIPTTSGTGTEVTPYSVLSYPSLQKKSGFSSPLIFPKISFLDPRYTLSLSYLNTRNTAIDALSHLLEGIYSNKRNKLNFPLIAEGIKLIYQNLIPSLSNPQNPEYREKLMLSSMYGGIVIAQSGTTLQHALGYPLTNVFGTSHGLANGVVMKNTFRLFYPAVQSFIDDIFDRINLSHADFFSWLDSLELRLGQKPNEDFIVNATDQVYQAKNMLLNPLKVGKNTISKIFTSIIK